MSDQDGKNGARLTVLAVGDLILDAPEPDSFFEHAAPVLKTGDVVIGQVEVPHTLRPLWSNAEPHSAPAADPEHLSQRRGGYDPEAS